MSNEQMADLGEWSMAMHRDPIVEEVRKHRQARAAKFNYDIGAMMADARTREKTSGHKLVIPPKRKNRFRPGKSRTQPSGPKE
jgi:hypothetical protein